MKHINSDNQQTLAGAPTLGLRAWLLTLILCCLPGMSLYDAALAFDSDPAGAPATAAGMQQPANTQAAANSRDGALHASRLLTLIQGSATPPKSTDATDSPASLLAPASSLSICDPRTAMLSKGYASNSLCLVTRHAAMPYSPRSPPALA